VVGHQNFEQADTATVCGKAVAYSARHTASNPVSSIPPVAAAGRAGHVVLGCIGQYVQFLPYFFVVHSD
jgi:hypothetical protein